MSWERLAADPELLYRLRPPDGPLAEALAEAAARGRPASLAVARLLEILAGGAEVARVLEVGRGAGAATICLARGAPRAEIVSLDREPPAEAIGARLERAGVAGRVTMVTGEPLAAIETLAGRFERIHLATPVPATRRLVDRLLPRLAVEGLLTVAGVRPDPGEEEARALAGYLVVHPQLDAQVLDLDGGLAVARKRRALVTEMGGPW